MKKRKITNSEIVQSYCPIVKFITECKRAKFLAKIIK